MSTNALHRSFSVADMKTNVTSGGSVRSGAEGRFKPGMPQTVSHSTSTEDFSLTMASAVGTLPDLGNGRGGGGEGGGSSSLYGSSPGGGGSGMSRSASDEKMTIDSGSTSLSSPPIRSYNFPTSNDGGGRTSSRMASGRLRVGVSSNGGGTGMGGSEGLGLLPAGDPAPASLFGGAAGFPVLPTSRRDRCTEDYHLLRELGRGLCGTVYLAREKTTGQIVAFKVMRKTKLLDVGEANHAAVERKLHEHINSGPFINRLIASFQDPWALILVLEYAPCGDLFQAMNFHGLPSVSYTHLTLPTILLV